MATDTEDRSNGPQASNGLHLPAWLGPVAGFAGTLLGILASLYSSDFRTALSTAGRRFTAPAISVLVAAVVASATTAIVFRWLIRRSQRRAEILPGEITIKSD